MLLKLSIFLTFLFEKVISEKSFQIDNVNNQFLLDGQPFRYIAGSIHYFRIPPSLWLDRLAKISALGLNAIQFYVPWNYHEDPPGKFNFEGNRDFLRFIRLAESQGLYTLLRIGPYSCGEWENGGLPWWLLKNPGIRQRSSDPRFTKAVENFFAVLLPKIKPYLRENGGPILMIQIENEYGSFPTPDPSYLIFLRDLVRKHLGNKVLLYTTDGASDHYLVNGAIPEVFATVDFGPLRNATESFIYQRKYNNGTGPLVNSEYYPGWLNLWGDRSNDVARPTEEVLQGAQAMYSLGASFNFYMIHGGTNFGFWAGAETNMPIVTSYDYTAPISESGDITEKYLGIYKWMESLSDWPKRPTRIPPNSTKASYGTVSLKRISTIQKSFINDCHPIIGRPLLFEEIDHPYGFLLYSTPISSESRILHLPIESFKDYAYIFVDDQYQGMLSRYPNTTTNTSLSLKIETSNPILSILIENQARQTYETINDYKGLFGKVYLEDRSGEFKILDQWKTCKVNLKALPTSHKDIQPGTYGIYYAEMTINRVADTFFDFTNWGKGLFFVNGRNMGRYWSLGPQMTLYVPSVYLKPGRNLIHVIELTEDGDIVDATGIRTLKSLSIPIWRWLNDERSQGSPPLLLRSNTQSNVTRSQKNTSLCHFTSFLAHVLCFALPSKYII